MRYKQTCAARCHASLSDAKRRALRAFSFGAPLFRAFSLVRCFMLLLLFAALFFRCLPQHVTLIYVLFLISSPICRAAEIVDTRLFRLFSTVISPFTLDTFLRLPTIYGLFAAAPFILITISAVDDDYSIRYGIKATIPAQPPYADCFYDDAFTAPCLYLSLDMDVFIDII